MKNFKITGISGAIPLDILTGAEFGDAVENLDILRAGYERITLTVTAEGHITVSFSDMNGVNYAVGMEAEL